MTPEAVGRILLAVFSFWLALLIGIAFGRATTPEDYSDGFCAARGGVAITSDYCDVEGKVVVVER